MNSSPETSRFLHSMEGGRESNASASSSPKRRTKLDPDVLQELRNSLASVGQINAIIRCKQHPDRVLSGRHREAAGASRYVDYDTDGEARRLGQTHEATEQIVRIHANTQRRVAAEERQAEFIALAETYHQEGTPEENCAQKVVEALGPAFSKVYVYRLLPERFKETRRTESIRAGIARGKVNSVYSDQRGATTTGKADGQIKASAGSENEGESSNTIEWLAGRHQLQSGTFALARPEYELRMLGMEKETAHFIQKVIFNPKVNLFYKYAVNAWGYKGDLADFTLECILGFFRDHEIRIIIERTL